MAIGHEGAPRQSAVLVLCDDDAPPLLFMKHPDRALALALSPTSATSARMRRRGKLVEAGPCHTTTTDTGVHHATFSNIRIGDIGSTVPPTPPTPPPPTPPTPPTPAPPAAGQCCYDGCTTHANCVATGFCGQSQTNCEGNCNGHWCPKMGAKSFI
jgi:hypothetical protein